MQSYMHSLLLTVHSTKFVRFLSNRNFVNALSMANGIVIDCKTVRIFAYSSTREQSNKRSGTRLKTESERLARFARVRLLRHALPISLLIMRKKPTVLQSSIVTLSLLSPSCKRHQGSLFVFVSSYFCSHWRCFKWFHVSSTPESESLILINCSSFHQSSCNRV